MDEMNTTESKEKLLFSDDILSIIYNSFLFLIGIPGNALIIGVYAVKKNNSSARIFIIGLAINDLILCLIRPLHVFDNLTMFVNLEDSSNLYCKVRNQFELLFLFTSVFITACIAIDRYYAVSRPFDRVISPQKAIFALVICVVLAILVLIPTFFMVGLLPRNGAYKCRRMLSDSFYYFQLSLYYSAVVGSQIVATILCVKIVRILRLQQSKVRPSLTVAIVDSSATSSTTCQSRERGTASQTDTIRTHDRDGSNTNARCFSKEIQSKTTKMLLMSTICFILLWSPTFIVYLIPVDVTDRRQFLDSPILLAIVQYFKEESYLLNIVINPVIYSVANRRFRDDSSVLIKRVLCRIKCSSKIRVSTEVNSTVSSHNWYQFT